MNIMQVVSSCPKKMNGAVNHCLLLTRELVRRGHRVTVVTQPDSWIRGQLESEPVEVVTSDLHRWPPDELRRIAAVARQRRIDVVHTHVSRAHFFGVLLRWFTGVPCVATAQSRHIQLHWMFNDRVIAVSEATRRFHRTYNLVRSNRIVTVHNFIDDGRLAHVPADAGSRFRASIGVESSALLIGVLASVNLRKGQHYLVRAMPKILAAVPEARLALVGGHFGRNYAAEIRSTIGETGLGSRVVLTGHRDDVHEALTAMDVVALPSLEESLPLSLLEAMAAGLPVVGTTAGGIPECVRSGENGTLVPPGDADALADALVPLLRDPVLRRRYGEAGRRRIRHEFSLEGQTARIESVFAGLVGRARAA